MRNEYLITSDLYEIYLSRDYCNIFVKLSNSKMYRLNSGAAEFLDLLRNMQPIKKTELFNLIEEDYGIEISRRYSEFVEDLIEKSILLLDNNKVKSNNFIGSKKFIAPKKITIELTDCCNSYCKHCYYKPNYNESVEINIESLFNKLSFLKKYDIDEIELTGGEPLLHSHFFEILQYCMHNFKRTIVLTNGLLINEIFVDKLMTIPVNNIEKRLYFAISYDSNKKDIYQQIRGCDGLFSVEKAIRLLRSKSFFVRAAMTIFPKINIEDIYSVYCYAKEELDVNLFVFSPYIPIGEMKNPWLENPTILINKILEQENKILAHEKSKSYKKLKRIMKESIENDSTNCGAGYNKFTVEPNGNIKICSLSPSDMFKIGNFLTDNLMDILNIKTLKPLIDYQGPNHKTCVSCILNYKFCQDCILHAIFSMKSANIKCDWYSKQTKSLKKMINLDAFTTNIYK